MSLPMKCPRCGLFNPDGSQVCDCGFSLTDTEGAAADRRRKRRQRSAVWLAVFAGSIAVFGAISFFDQAVLHEVRSRVRDLVGVGGEAGLRPEPSLAPLLTAIAALLTALVSLGGVAITAVVTMRKERRETQQFDFTRKRQELELQELIRRLDRTEGSDGGNVPNRKSRNRKRRG